MLNITVNVVQGGIMPTDMAEASADRVRLRCWTGDPRIATLEEVVAAWSSISPGRTRTTERKGERRAAIAPLTPKILDEYGCELAHWLDTALRETSSARAIVTRGIRLTRDVIALQIDIQTGPIRPLGVFAIEQPDLFHASLLEEAEDRLLAKFKSGRNMRIYTAKTIYIVKPDEKRFWTVSDAQTDMCSIIDDVQKRVANAPMLAHWRLESKPSVGLTFH
jgi:hypothetical protein